MSAYPIVTLKRGKEASARHRHPWIFSGALEKAEGLEHGALVTVQAADGSPLGVGTYSSRSAIAVRLFAFGEAVIDAAWLAQRFREAEARRQLLGYGLGTSTDGYRVIFGEADGVPGLVVDRFTDVLVVQISTAGLNRLKNDVVESLRQVFAPRAIYERSDLPSRRDEGLPEVCGPLYGEAPELVEFHEYGRHCLASPVGGQKTGFFLDQKDLRQAIGRLARGRRMLNLFSYTGTQAVAALAGGAVSAHNVDVSVAALELVARQAELNNLPTDGLTVEEADVFQWLSEDHAERYDLVAVDPPALIKSAKDAEAGRKAYHFLNRAALRLVEDDGIFVTSSCSHYLTEEDLAFVLRRASIQAGVVLDIMQVVHQAPDHPLSVYFPESSYLKSFICRVRREK